LFSAVYLCNGLYNEAKKVEERAEEMDTSSVEKSSVEKSSMEKSSVQTSSVEKSSAVPVNQSLTSAQSYIHHQVQVTEAKEQIATLCTAVISSPQDEVIIALCVANYN